MDAIYVILCAAGHNFRLLAKWFRRFGLRFVERFLEILILSPYRAESRAA